MWCYTESTTVPEQEFSEISDNIRYNKVVPENFENKKGKPCLLILDDLLDFVYSKEVCNLFTKDIHHRINSVDLITHNLFHQGRYCRELCTECQVFDIVKAR
jgi:hypothetical protein